MAARIADRFRVTGAGRPYRPSARSCARAEYTRHERGCCGCSLADIAAVVAWFDGKEKPYAVTTVEGWEHSLRRLERAEGAQKPLTPCDSKAFQALKYAERRYDRWTPRTSPSPRHRRGLALPSARHRATLVQRATEDASSSRYSAQDRRYLTEMARGGPARWRTLEELRVLHEEIERLQAAAAGRDPDTSISATSQAVRRWCELAHLVAEQEREQRRGRERRFPMPGSERRAGSPMQLTTR